MKDPYPMFAKPKADNREIILVSTGGRRTPLRDMDRKEPWLLKDGKVYGFAWANVSGVYYCELDTAGFSHPQYGEFEIVGLDRKHGVYCVVLRSETCPKIVMPLDSLRDMLKGLHKD
jgi:hypothetical protein